MAKNPFKVGDRVYVYPIGWGTVNLASIDTCEIDFDGAYTKTGDWRVASFTEYDPVKGALIAERPDETTRPAVATSQLFETNDVDWETIRRNALSRLGKKVNRIDRFTEEEALKELKSKQDTIPVDVAERNP